MNNKDCCCLCFTTRQGVMAIGILTWLGVFSNFASLIWSLQFGETDLDGIAWGFFLPNMLFNLSVALKFCALINNEHTVRDHKTRLQFYRYYLAFAVVMQALMSFIGYGIMNGIVSESC